MDLMKLHAVIIRRPYIVQFETQRETDSVNNKGGRRGASGPRTVLYYTCQT